LITKNDKFCHNSTDIYVSTKTGVVYSHTVPKELDPQSFHDII
jgi:hypothetical protein